MPGRHDIQHNDSQYSDTQHKDIQHNGNVLMFKIVLLIDNYRNINYNCNMFIGQAPSRLHQPICIMCKGPCMK